jgi:hypothetical protein
MVLRPCVDVPPFYTLAHTTDVPIFSNKNNLNTGEKESARVVVRYKTPVSEILYLVGIVRMFIKHNRFPV